MQRQTQARQLRIQGEELYGELYRQANKTKDVPFGRLSAVYLGQAEDWCSRFMTFVRQHLSEKALYDTTVGYPGWTSLVGVAAMGSEAQKKLVNELDQMFTANLAALTRIEKKP